MYPLEEDPATVHFAALDGDRVLAVGSVMADAHPHDPADGDWRVRGRVIAARHADFIAPPPEAPGRRDYPTSEN